MASATSVLLRSSSEMREAISAWYAGAWGLTPGVESRDALSDVRKLGAGGLLQRVDHLPPHAAAAQRAVDRHAADARAAVLALADPVLRDLL